MTFFTERNKPTLYRKLCELAVAIAREGEKEGEGGGELDLMKRWLVHKNEYSVNK